jgi:predicted MPP superfamily phosphohydrolase
MLASLSDAPFAQTALAVLLLVGASAGNAALLAAGLNWMYAQLYPRWLLKICRVSCGLLILAMPVALWWLYGFALPAGWDLNDTTPRNVAAAYVLVCWVLGLGVFPLITLRRLTRRRPGPLLSNHTQTVDIARRLGYKPVGKGKYRWMARLPLNEVFRVDFAEKTFCLPRLPAAWDGLSILHLSDLHFCGTPDRVFYQQIVELCREQEPDILAVTGDIVDSHRHHRWVLPVLGRLRWKIAAFAILGNHDSWHEPDLVRRRLRRAGMRVLGNSWEEIAVHGQRLAVIGNETPWFAPGPDLSNCPTDIFRLCLSHTPDTMPWARQNSIDLMLAGHNHGGQVRFPVIGSVFVPSKYSRRYDCGVFHEPPTLLHVSRGLGGKEPLRWNCKPEVVRIVLRCGEARIATHSASAQTTSCTGASSGIS